MDYVILGVLAISVLFGLYRGFIQTVFNMGGCLLSFLLSFLLFPTISSAISGNAEITRVIMSYTDAGSLLGNLELSRQSVSGLSGAAITEIVQKLNLPSPMGTLLQHNLEQQVFAPMGASVDSVAQYINQTIVSVSINVISFAVCFAVCFILVSILINLLRAVFRFPVLKQLDWLAGGVFGLARGVLLCFVLFTLLPLVLSVAPIEELQTLVDSSQLAGFFRNSNLIISIMNRRL